MQKNKKVAMRKNFAQAANSFTHIIQYNFAVLNGDYKLMKKILFKIEGIWLK